MEKSMSLEDAIKTAFLQKYGKEAATIDVVVDPYTEKEIFLVSCGDGKAECKILVQFMRSNLTPTKVNA